MKRWMKVEALPLLAVLAVHAWAFSVGHLPIWQIVIASVVFLLIPAAAGVFYGYAVAAPKPAVDEKTGARWEVVDTTKGGA